ncbi:AbrB/MazE/SpoVT family DNA-binding domain-containing protein [uncultured Methanomethylovorans sp.]|uniref:AbrB/MazE/SpoVT family DNA-binding domain-containing protein n=1 Tax=uncultured Methanomethylovorans sp. TaxID=183759 RepID=UPI002AA7FE71|nr:AbrB/MazE/SpoVT family DNA-binding domain-containing protein [uncultured Methanomethylovorans sp.]
MKRKVQKIRDSYQVVIPKQFADMVGIGAGTMMEIEYRNRKIIMCPVTPSQDATGTGQE